MVVNKRRRKRIYIYNKSKEEVSFLNNFFQKKKTYDPEFFSDFRGFKKRVEETPPDLVITNSPQGISKIHLLDLKLPLIAVISTDLHEGVRTAAKCDAHCYITRPFNEAELDLKIKTAIKRQNWFEKLYQEKKDLETIVELSYLITSTLNPKEVLFFVVKKISEILDVSRCSILSLGFKEKKYAYVVSSFEDPAISGIKIDLKKYPEIKRVLDTKRPVVINDAMKDKTMLSVKKLIAPLGIKSIMVIPIIFRDEVIGTLFLRTSKKSSVFSDREIRLCKTVANVSSNALYNAFLFEKLETEKNRLESLAITDYLTEVFNIRYIYHRLEEEFSRLKRYKTSVGCIMMDIDYFKKINDTYGHKTGDKVLHEFAQLVDRHTRKSDIFARYGGEEFILILPHTTSEGSFKEADRLMEVIRTHQFKGIKRGAITVSMGIAHSPDKRVHAYEDLITLADNALFEAKKKGRNTIIINHQHLENKME